MQRGLVGVQKQGCYFNCASATVSYRAVWLMGVDQNYGPFWGLYYSIFLIVYSSKDREGPIILINPLSG